VPGDKKENALCKSFTKSMCYGPLLDKRGHRKFKSVCRRQNNSTPATRICGSVLQKHSFVRLSPEWLIVFH
jgi:hypothetical protein